MNIKNIFPSKAYITLRDEREQRVMETSAWRSTIVLVLTYLIISAIYMFTQQPTPWSLQVLFWVTFVTFAANSIKQEGYSFIIPGMPETKETLNQPAAVRSLPWITMFGGFILIILGIFRSIPMLHRTFEYSYAETAVFVICASILSLFLNWLFALWIKKGVRWFISLAIVGSIIQIIVQIAGMGLIATTSVTSEGSEPIASPANFFTASEAIALVMAVWLLYVLVRYRSLMIKDGHSFDIPDNRPTLDSSHSAIVLQRLILASLIISAVGLTADSLWPVAHVATGITTILGATLLIFSFIYSLIKNFKEQ